MSEELPLISQKEYRALKCHWAGKKVAWICKKFGMTRAEFSELMDRTKAGYRVEGGYPVDQPSKYQPRRRHHNEA